MNKKYLILSSVVILGLGLLLVVGISRKNPILIDNNTINKNQIVAKNSASILSQDGSDFRLNLSFKAKDATPKTIMKYYVSLYKSDDNKGSVGYSPIDIAKYEDSVVLLGSENGVKREIIYNAPKYLTGKYNLTVDYVNEAGMSMESIELGSVDLKSGYYNEFVEILPETCYLYISNDSNDKRYDLMQGVDVKAGDNLMASCVAISHFARDISITPKFINYRRKNLYDEKQVQEEQKYFDRVTFSHDEKKEIHFSIPKALDPQAYDAVMALYDERGYVVSGKIFFHYIVTGESATIQDVVLDNYFYTSGSMAKIKVLSGGSADIFEGSRHGGTKNDVITGEIDILDDSGSCLAEHKFFDLTQIDALGTNLELQIIRDCHNPWVDMAIRGDGGKILDEKILLDEKK